MFFKTNVKVNKLSGSYLKRKNIISNPRVSKGHSNIKDIYIPLFYKRVYKIIIHVLYL